MIADELLDLVSDAAVLGDLGDLGVDDGGDDFSVADEAAVVSKNWMVGNFDMVSRLWFQRTSKNLSIPLPKWQRISFLALAKMRKDGHSQFADGVLNDFVSLPRNNKLTDEINKAVDYGFLAPGSNRRCLIAPFDVRYLSTKDVRSSCSWH